MNKTDFIVSIKKDLSNDQIEMLPTVSVTIKREKVRFLIVIATIYRYVKKYVKKQVINFFWSEKMYIYKF